VGAGVELVGAVAARGGEAEAVVDAGAGVGGDLAEAGIARTLGPQLNVGQAGGGAARISGAVGHGEGGAGAVARRAGRGHRRRRVDQGRVVGRGRGGLVVAGLVVGAGVELVGAVGARGGEAEAVVDAGAGGGGDLAEAGIARTLGPQLNVGQAGGGAARIS